MTSKNVNIDLYGEQSTILHDWLTANKHCLSIVPVGSGKTFLASIALPIFASDPKYHNGKDIIYSAPTNSMIKSLIWEPLKQSCRDHFGIHDSQINNSELTIRFPNGIFIRCKSAEQRENLRGLNVGRWIADEAALYTEEVLMEIFNRLRPKVGQPDTVGKMIIISTPKGAGPLYTLYQNAQQDPSNYLIHHYTYEQMRSGNLKFIEEQKRILSPMKFASDYLCSFESIEDQFFYTWDTNKYTKPILMDGTTDLYSFHDFNKKRMAAMVCRVKNAHTSYGTIEVLKSYALYDCSTGGIAEAIRKDFPKHRISAIIDMSGTQVNRDTTSTFGTTDRTILEKYGFTIVNSRKVNPLISDTDNTSNAFINNGRLIVDPDDNQTLEALTTYHFEDGTRKKLVKYQEAKFMHIDGLGDCLRYGIHHLFPIQHEDSTTNYVSFDAKYKVPGSEYLPDSPLFPGGPTWDEIVNGDDTPDHVIW